MDEEDEDFIINEISILERELLQRQLLADEDSIDSDDIEYIEYLKINIQKLKEKLEEILKEKLNKKILFADDTTKNLYDMVEKFGTDVCVIQPHSTPYSKSEKDYRKRYPQFAELNISTSPSRVSDVFGLSEYDIFKIIEWSKTEKSETAIFDWDHTLNWFPIMDFPHDISSFDILEFTKFCLGGERNFIEIQNMFRELIEKEILIITKNYLAKNKRELFLVIIKIICPYFKDANLLYCDIEDNKAEVYETYLREKQRIEPPQKKQKAGKTKRRKTKRRKTKRRKTKK